MQRLGLDVQTLFGMPPVEHLHLAADLGCGHISLGLTPLPWKLERFPDWSLRENARLRHELISAMSERGVRVLQGEGFSVRSGVDARDLASDMDIFFELGTHQISGVCMETDMTRAFDQFSQLADMAAERQMRVVIEFALPHAIGSVDQAIQMTKALNKTNVRIVVDTMHFFRSGGTLQELAALDSSLIGYIQLCDVPLQAVDDDYFKEACFNRQLPGDGDLPLEEALALLPVEIPIGLEIPMLSSVRRGVPLPDLAAHMVRAATHMLAAI